jgi:hypothetical protein
VREGCRREGTRLREGGGRGERVEAAVDPRETERREGGAFDRAGVKRSKS